MIYERLSVPVLNPGISDVWGSRNKNSLGSQDQVPWGTGEARSNLRSRCSSSHQLHSSLRYLRVVEKETWLVGRYVEIVET